MMPSARKQAIRMGAARGRELARMHLASGHHVGELNRIRKRLKDDRTAEIIFDGVYLRRVERWAPVMVRAFQRAALGMLACAAKGKVP